MFALRGLIVSLTFFVIIYAVLSLLVAGSWRSVRLLHLKSERNLANLLFGLRILPVVGSAIVTLGVVVPSFQMLEPRSIEEKIGLLPLALGLCAILFIACGAMRVVMAQTRTLRVVARWMEGANPLPVETEAATFCARHEAPPLTLVGVCKPKVLVSKSAISLLKPDELRIALRHELAHVRSRDNLKKLMIRFSPFPAMAELESAWSQSAELAADDAAVSNSSDALDLAAALVKLSRLVPVVPAPVCTVGFVTGSVSARVARLLAWDEMVHTRQVRMDRHYAVFSVLGALLCAWGAYTPALAVTHQITEWIVR